MLVGVLIGKTTLESCLRSDQAKYLYTLGPNNSVLNTYPYVHEKTDKNAYSSTLCSGSKVDTTQMEVAVEYLNGL